MYVFYYYVDRGTAKNIHAEIILNNNTFIVFGKESNAKALVIEGNLESKIDIIGVAETLEGKLIYSKACNHNPIISVNSKVKDLVAFISHSSNTKEKGVFILKNCKNRLLIEPLTISLMISCTWTFKDNMTCIMLTKSILSINQLIVTLTFQDAYFLLGILQYQLKHIMSDYIERAYKYYLPLKQNSSYNAQKLIAHRLHLNQSMVKVRAISGDFTPLKNMSDISAAIKDTLSLLNSFRKDMNKLNSLNRRSELVKQNNEFVPVKNDELDNSQIINYEVSEIVKHDKEIKASFEHDIKGIYINDISGMFYPLLEIEMAVPFFRILQNEKEDKIIEFKGKTSASYYHCAASAWEPLWEPFRVEYSSESSTEKTQKVIKLLFPDKINLNITDTLILLIKDNIELWNSKDSEKIESRNLFIRKWKKSESNYGRKSILNSEYDSITEFIVKNHTGVVFYITVKDSMNIQRQPIFPEETVNLLIDPSEALSKIKQIGRNIVNIRIDFDEETGIPPIERLNLSYVKEFSHTYVIKDKKHYFICSTKIERMRKVFSISTPLSITNELDMPIILYFEILAKEPVEYKLEPGIEFNIPINLLQETARAAIKETDSEKLSASKFDFKSLIKLFDSHKAVQLTLAKGMYGVFALRRNSGMNSSNFCLLPPYNFINCLAVKVKLQFLSSCTTIKLEPGKSAFIYSSNTTTSLLLNISLPHFARQEVKFKYNPDLLDIPIDLKDDNGNEVTIYMRIITNTTARYSIILYSKAYIINWSKQNLTFYYRNEDEGEVPVAGQYIEDKSVTLLKKHSSFVCYFDDFYSSIPISFNKNTPSMEFSIEYKKKPHYGLSLAEFVVLTQKEILLSDYNVTSKVFNIYPKYIFRNKTRTMIVISQTNIPKSRITTCSNEEIPFFWHSKDGPKTIRLSYPKSLASEPFDPSETGSFVQELLRSTDRKMAGILRIDCIRCNGIYYIEAHCEFVDKSSYMISNTCENISFMYKQHGVDTDWKYLDSNTSTPFGWIKPNDERLIELKFLWGKFKERPIELPMSEKIFSMKEIKAEESVDIKLCKTIGKLVWVSLEYDGYSKILKVSDTRKSDLGKSPITERFVLNASGIGISLVTSQETKRLELLYAAFDTLQLLAVKTMGKMDLYFSIQKFQIDNQSKQSPVFPVILHRTKEESSNVEENTFFQLVFAMNELSNSKSKFYNFDFVNITVSPITIKLDEEIVMLLYDFFMFATNSFSTKSIHDTSSLNNSQNKPRLRLSTPLITQELITEKQNVALVPTVYITEFTLQKLSITVWFKPGVSYSRKKQGALLKTLADAFLDVEALPIVLDKIIARKLSAKITVLLLGIAEFYQEKLSQQKLFIISSLLFPPIKNIDNISTGIVEMLKNSSDRREKGSGLVKNAIIGTFGAVARITATASKGVLALSNDEEYISTVQREEEKLKPNYILGGFGLGAYSAIRSVASALYGVVSKPVEGAMQEGVGGLVKGTFKGLAGVIVKPISGGLDFFSKTTEAVKNTAVLFDESNGKIIEVERMRRPRVFYTSQNLIQEYDEHHAKMLVLLSELEGGKYLTNNFLDIGIEEGKELGIVLITEEHVVHFVNDKIKWETSTKYIALIELDSSSIILHLSDGNKVDALRLSFASKDAALSIYNKLNNCIIND